MKRVFVSDCEGPISKNDNAFELTAQYAPGGDRLFTIISKYDDVLADVIKRANYNAGDTLKLVLPFLKAYGVTDKIMQEFSTQTLRLIAGTQETLNHLFCLAEAFIVSTSYEHYIRALCKFVDFPFENTYCTRLSLDKYAVTPSEKNKLKDLSREIAAMPMITIPAGGRALEDFTVRDQETINRLNKIFWTEIPAMRCGEIFSEVLTVGGEQKAQAVGEITTKLCLPLSSVMYVGDSITDVQAFQRVHEGDGLTVSFNGNSYAVEKSEVSVMSDNNIVTAVLADVFLKHGKPEALKLVQNWNPESLRCSSVEPSLLKRFFDLFPHALPKVQIVTQANMESLTKESTQFRKHVRGEAVGKLG